jgi:apolipoprotein N-acyltransferase
MFKKIILSFLSGVLLFLSWPPFNLTTPLIFIAFIPLFIIERDIIRSENGLKKLFLFSYITFFIFNLLTTWWICYAHVGGAVFAILCNAFFMALVLCFSTFVKQSFKWHNSLIILPIVWLGFEYLHFNWDLSWPWLSLGNVFASHPNWIQWYSYTGVSGGTLWILIVNLIVFRLYEARTQRVQMLNYSILLLFSFLIPFALSYILLKKYQNINSVSTMNVMVVQPNIDPYSEKFTIDQRDQTSIAMDMINNNIEYETDLLVLPETFLSAPIWEHRFSDNLDVKIFNNLLLKYTNLNILFGAPTLSYVDKSPSSKRSHNHAEKWYEVYNSAILLNVKTLDIYHKSKLVPGAEQLPFNNILYPLLGDIILDIGNSNSVGSFGSQDSVSVFTSFQNIKIAPIICYESIYPDYVRQFTFKGAQVIFIITNDGWWKETSGYQQHNMYAQLRAIESRRYIARAANTGISSIINHLGAIETSLGWNQRDVIKCTIPLFNKKTFYVIHGDYLGRISAFISVVLGLMLFINFIIPSSKRE